MKSNQSEMDQNVHNEVVLDCEAIEGSKQNYSHQLKEIVTVKLKVRCCNTNEEGRVEFA